MRNSIAWIAGTFVLIAAVITVLGTREKDTVTTTEYLLAGQFEESLESQKGLWHLYSPPCSWELPSSNSIEPSESEIVSESLCTDVTEEEIRAELKPGDRVTVDRASFGVVIREAYRKRFAQESQKREFKPRPISGPEGLAFDVLFHESGVRRAVRIRTLPDTDP